jgi:hypothetical protein
MARVRFDILLFAAIALAGSLVSAHPATAEEAAAAAGAATAAPAALPMPSAVLTAMVADQSSSTSSSASGDQGGGGGYFANWTKRVDATQAEQPHWMTPVVTVTPRLEEEVRYDQLWQQRPNQADLTNFGSNKGLELIPAEPIEVIVGIPGYETLSTPKGTKEGWADESFLIKYRAVTANEENGNYILTGFLGVSVPTGDPAFTNAFTIWTPTIAGGKGWGTRTEGFDIQSTLAMSFPGGNEKVLGEPLVWNTAFQGHILSERFWPEVEVQYTHFHDGPNDGRSQTVLTFGAIAGRFPITGRLRLAIGGGYEQAVGGFHTFNHAWVLTLRTPF